MTRLAKRILIFLVAIMLLAQIPMLKETLARGVTTLYVKIKCPEHSFQFQDFNYESHFGNYIISYTDQDEQRISLMLEPKFFPVLIIYDPLNQPMKE